MSLLLILASSGFVVVGLSGGKTSVVAPELRSHLQQACLIVLGDDAIKVLLSKKSPLSLDLPPPDFNLSLHPSKS